MRCDSLEYRGYLGAVDRDDFLEDMIVGGVKSRCDLAREGHPRRLAGGLLVRKYSQFAYVPFTRSLTMSNWADRMLKSDRRRR